MADSNIDGIAQIPLPTVLLVDDAGMVAFADVHLDYTTRTEAAAIIDQVRALTRIP